MKVYSDFLLFSLWSVLFGYYCIIWVSLYVRSSLSHYPKKTRFSVFSKPKKKYEKREWKSVSFISLRNNFTKRKCNYLDASKQFLNWKITWQSENIVSRGSSVFSIRFNAKRRLFIKHVKEIQFTMHQVIGSLYRAGNRLSPCIK